MEQANNTSNTWSKLIFSSRPITRKNVQFFCAQFAHVRTRYELICVLCTLHKSDSKSYDEICNLLTSHFNPRPPKFAERAIFNSRVRVEQRRINTAVHHSFASSLSLLSLGLRLLSDFVRLVVGVNNDVLQKKLLAETSISLAKEIEIANESNSDSVQDSSLVPTFPFLIFTSKKIFVQSPRFDNKKI